jgi:hypothetical protein
MVGRNTLWTSVSEISRFQLVCRDERQRLLNSGLRGESLMKEIRLRSLQAIEILLSLKKHHTGRIFSGCDDLVTILPVLYTILMQIARRT